MGRGCVAWIRSGFLDPVRRRRVRTPLGRTRPATRASTPAVAVAAASCSVDDARTREAAGFESGGVA